MVARGRTLLSRLSFSSLTYACLLIQLTAVGCVSTPRQTARLLWSMPRKQMSNLWSSVSQGPWSHSESDEDPKQPEPSVTANAAMAIGVKNDSAGTSSETPSGSSVVSTDSGKLKAPEVASISRSPMSSRPSESSNAASNESGGISKSQVETVFGKREPSDAISPDGLQTVSVDDNIERLKAALNDDAHLVKEPARQPGGAYDVRVRVESMLERAKRLFASGNLREARHTAQIAQDLGETASLDFALDEERPVDVVHQIDDQLKASTQRTPPADLTASTSGRPPSSSSLARNSSIQEDPSRGSSASRRDATRGRSRLDWAHGLNVFRREKKSNLPDLPVNSSIPIPANADANSEVVQVQLGLDVNSESNVKINHAVVQANRSVTLAASSSADWEPGSASQQNDSATPTNHSSIGNDPQEDSGDRGTAFNSPSSDAKATSETSWTFDDGRDVRRLPIAEETASPEIDEVRPIARFHDVARKPRVEQIASSPPPMDGLPWGWIAAVIAIGICGIFAVFRLRRGTT